RGTGLLAGAVWLAACAVCWLALTKSGTPVICPEIADDEPDPRRLLEQVVSDVLTNPDLASIRESFGPAGEKRIALLKESTIKWPSDWLPHIPGYEFEYRTNQRPIEDFIYWCHPLGPELVSLARRIQPRLLAISLEKI